MRLQKKNGYKEVMEVIEDTLVRSSSSDIHIPSLNIMEALITAAIDENVHLDRVYLLLRRQPDVLVKLLSQTSSMIGAPASNNNDNNNNNDKFDNNNGSNGKNDWTSNMSVAKNRMNSTTTK
jgi:hypothetical protein